MTAQTDWSSFQPKDFSEKVASSLKEIKKTVAAGPYKPTWESLETYRIPVWYKDAKLGIFIHWGVYCVPEYGNEWYPRNMYIDKDDWRGNAYKHHREKYGDQKTVGYKDLIPQLTASKFDAQEWAKLFKEAGARYVVPVAEHHDGFPMYDCGFTQWSATQMGPKRDIVAQLAEAVRAEDMYFGVSSHRAFNWLYFVRNKDFDNADPKFAGLYGRPIPQLFKADAADYKKNWPPQDQEFKDEWLARTCELVDKYNPDLIWFDFGIANDKEGDPKDNHFAEHLQRFAAYYYNDAAKDNQRVPVINYKWHAFPEKAAVLDLERSKLDKKRELFWQTDTSVAKNSWGYTAKQNYKPVNRLIDDFIDIVSKNGCLLLNIGPKSDGTIPEQEQKMLREIGAWLKINGEAIYSSRPFEVYGEGPTGTATGHLSENKNKPFGSEDFRFTTNKGNTYAFMLDKPKSGEALIKSLKKNSPYLAGPIKSVSMLGSDSQIEWKQTDEGLVIKLPGKLPSPHAVTFKIN
ncbi:MAG: alpha-L-fucosidase [Planctomycetota bacterium]